MFMASGKTPVRKDTELFLRYGGHANRTLFVEYGFVNMWNETECYEGKFNGEADVQNIMEDLFASKGGVGRAMRQILEEEGYWGYSCLPCTYSNSRLIYFVCSFCPHDSDWTMHSRPTPAHPSYRLVSALRLLHADVEHDFEEACGLWRSVLMGQAEMISNENERAWRETLLEICEKIALQAKTAIASAADHVASEFAESWLGWVEKNIEMLWREELEVAEAVAQSVRTGVDF